ncbi:MAG: sulfatase-like hydrolase/transferase [Verrucomicrobia bacterium]|nr:sulfatase-like hydrolase/transferase [Verrucomicrobiota bacterium]
MDSITVHFPKPFWNFWTNPKRGFISTLKLACALAVLGGALTAAEPPNIILLMGDDHGWDETAYNGHPHLVTPVLDEMAAFGLRLDRFYSGAPVCSPTRGSFLTGRHPNRYGTFTPNWSIRPEEITIGHIMKQAGYATAHFGKWHVGPVKADSPTNPGAMGFDEWLSHDNFFDMNPIFSRNGGPPKKYEGESSEIVIDETIRFIKEAKQKKKSFMAVVWFGSPHEPYIGLKKDLALYANLPEKYKEQTVALTSIETGLRVTRPLNEVLQERYAEITAMDRAIGKLRDYLDDANLRENTIVWYCGDNGVPSSANVTNPFRGLKGNVYEGGIRVPGIIEWPARIPEPRISDVNTVTSDILPTLCDLADQSLPGVPIDGVSLEPLLNGEMTERPEPICFWNYNTGPEENSGREPYIEPELQAGTTPLLKQMNGVYTRTFRNLKHPKIAKQDYEGPRAITSSRYKLVIDGERSGEPARELFDLRLDPYEEHDLAQDLPAIVEILEKQLVDWQDSVLHSLTGGDY